MGKSKSSGNNGNGNSSENISSFQNLNKREQIERAKVFSEQYRVDDGSNFQLKNYDTYAHFDLGDEDKSLVADTLQMGIEALVKMQDVLYAQGKWSLLLVFQAMDAAGKDGAIKHVMSGINPQGCQVSSFKAPSNGELDHDFLWRCQKHLPGRGRIGIFNRSYYEEVLVVRVHEQILRSQKLAKELITDSIWEERFEDIRNFEKYLNRNGTIVIKFFLNVSKEEQKKRFIERIDDADKNWKFSTTDVKERGHWEEYMNAYEDLIQNTATKDSPWYVVPADNKSYARIVIASAIINALDDMDLAYPKVSDEKIKIGDIIGLDALKLLKDKNFAIFFISSILICIPLAFYYQNAHPFLTEAGVENPTGKMAIGQISEALFLLLIPVFFTRFGFKKTILVGMLAWAIRYALFAYGNGTDLSFMLIIGIALHGICYDFFFVSGQIYTNSKAGEKYKSAAQGLITLATYGVGMLIGFAVAGWITDNYKTATGTINWEMVWIIPAGIALAVFVLFALTFNDKNKTEVSH